jgi:hypothetical protein
MKFAEIKTVTEPIAAINRGGLQTGYISGFISHLNFKPGHTVSTYRSASFMNGNEVLLP